jgi:hypothetical protein
MEYVESMPTPTDMAKENKVQVRETDLAAVI